MPNLRIVTDETDKDSSKKIKNRMGSGSGSGMGIGIVKKIIIAVLIVAAIAAGIVLWLAMRKLTEVEVVNTSSSGANASVKYLDFNSKIVRYSNDGISCIDDSFEAIWSQGYSMSSPLIDVTGSYIVAADYGGNDIYILNDKGLVKKLTVANTVDQVKISSKGYVFAILTDNDKKYMKYFDTDGNLIAEGLVQLKKTGYPVNCDISDDGRLLVMSYLYVSNGIMKSSVVFYNFDSAGQTEIDKIVASYEYDAAVIPEVKFFGNDTAVAIADANCYIYQGKDKPSLKKTIEFTDEVQSIFYGNNKFGVTFNTRGAEMPYKTDIYKADGSSAGSFSMDFRYDAICFAGDNILVYDDTDCKLYTGSGSEKMSHSFDERIIQLQPINGGSKYVLVSYEKAELIKFK